MAAKMAQNCLSDKEFLLAAVSKGSVTNLNKLPQNYAPGDYCKISYARFEQFATVFFLTGGTRSAASANYSENLLKEKKGKKKSKEDVTDRSSPKFKADNWVVKLYDFGMCTFIPILCCYYLNWNRQITRVRRRIRAFE